MDTSGVVGVDTPAVSIGDAVTVAGELLPLPPGAEARGDFLANFLLDFGILGSRGLAGV